MMKKAVISDERAKVLLETEKTRTTSELFTTKHLEKEPIIVPLESKSLKEKFIFDISQKRIILKIKAQLRVRTSTVLARLDMYGEHRNPDGTEIGAPHIHLYSEKYGDKVALPVKWIRDPDDPKKSLEDFMKRFNVRAVLFAEDISGNEELF